MGHLSATFMFYIKSLVFLILFIYNNEITVKYLTSLEITDMEYSSYFP